MKTVMECIMIMILFFVATTALLQVDRQCADMYGKGGNISASVELLTENQLNLG